MSANTVQKTERGVRMDINDDAAGLSTIHIEKSPNGTDLSLTVRSHAIRTTILVNLPVNVWESALRMLQGKNIPVEHRIETKLLKHARELLGRVHNYFGDKGLRQIVLARDVQAFFELSSYPIKDLEAPAASMVTKKQNPLLQLFDYKHLPAHLQEVSKPFHDLAQHIATLPDNIMRETSLMKLIEAKDAAVRAVVWKSPATRIEDEQ